MRRYSTEREKRAAVLVDSILRKLAAKQKNQGDGPEPPSRPDSPSSPSVPKPSPPPSSKAPKAPSPPRQFRPRSKRSTRNTIGGATRGTLPHKSLSR